MQINERQLTPEVIGTVNAKTARMYQCLPVALVGGTLQLALVDPLNPGRIDELNFVLKRDLQMVVANPAQVEKLIEKFYPTADTLEASETFSELLKELGADKEIAEEVSVATATDDKALMEDLANQAPIVRFVNLVLFQAVQDRASDIHFEPFETEFRIRYRVDGALYEMSPPPKQLALPVISRLKVMANLNISETRMPQDGRINYPLGSRSIDLRVSTLPTQFGESVVLRVLDRSAISLEIESLGFPKYLYDYTVETIQRPNGIFVVTGPTGCGKTTTLYSCLRRVNTMDSKLLTAEDPVEYDIEGIMQVAIHESVGLTFSKALRSFLRQDPDITTMMTFDIEVIAVNDAPTLDNYTVTTKEDVSVYGTVLGTDMENDPLTYSKITDPANGTVTVNADGTFTYTPDDNYYGEDSFTVEVNDGHDEHNTGEGTVTIIVTSANDKPSAVNDEIFTPEDIAIIIDALSNDVDVDIPFGDSLSIVSVGTPVHGSAQIVDGKIVYTPSTNWNGTDEFIYTIKDGDGELAAAMVTVTVTPVNDQPSGGNDTAETDEDTEVMINVTVNDDIDETTNPTLEDVTIFSVNDPAHGTATRTADKKSIIYMPDPD